ncbi:MAG: hypothetical protein KGQ60_10165 [Planctomycetes bacterium]|nr:hypothetical protein [Planctomycetota bacterium]
MALLSNIKSLSGFLFNKTPTMMSFNRYRDLLRRDWLREIVSEARRCQKHVCPGTLPAEPNVSQESKALRTNSCTKALERGFASKFFLPKLREGLNPTMGRVS